MYVTKLFQLTSSASEKLQEAIFQLLKYFERNVGLDEDSSRPDFSVFTGTCGNAQECFYRFLMVSTLEIGNFHL